MNPYIYKRCRDLLRLARENSECIEILDAVLEVLHDRQNDIALEALLEVGFLRDQASLRLASERKAARSEAGREERQKARMAGFFKWPNTDAPASRHGFTGEAYWYEEGLLSFVGYRVGRAGESRQIRQDILDCVFHNELPRVSSREYMSEWHEPKTPERLKKMAETLAAFARNFKRRSGGDYTQAIEDWEMDLQYLYDEYYVSVFNFAWPVSKGDPITAL